MPYSIEWERKATKALGRLPHDAQVRIVSAVSDLAQEPRPDGVKKLKGDLEGFYRIKVGRDHRVIYAISDDARVVVIEALGPRGAMY